MKKNKIIFSEIRESVKKIISKFYGGGRNLAQTLPLKSKINPHRKKIAAHRLARK